MAEGHQHLVKVEPQGGERCPLRSPLLDAADNGIAYSIEGLRHQVVHWRLDFVRGHLAHGALGDEEHELYLERPDQGLRIFDGARPRQKPTVAGDGQGAESSTGGAA